MKPIPEGVPDEIRLVLLCRAIRQIQKKRGPSFGDAADLLKLEHQLDQKLAFYAPDAELRAIRP